MMANFEELFNKYNPLAEAVPGGADLEAKNAYWIELGARRAEERIIKLLRDVGYPESTITLIKGENK